MGWWDTLLGRRDASPAETRSLEDPQYKISENPDALLRLFGVLDAQGSLPIVPIAAALQVPAVFAAVAFLSRTLAALPLHTFEAGQNGAKVEDEQAQLLNVAPNAEWSSFGWRQYHWQQVFTGGRGVSWIERVNGRTLGIWPMDPSKTMVGRRNGRKYYRFENIEYPAADVIDTPFMLRSDQLSVLAPLTTCNKAVSLAIAMSDFAGSFFMGGGVPPLALGGPMPSGVEAFRRAQNDIQKAIDLAKKSNSNFFPLPPGHELKPVGFDPAKGQMTEARLFQIQEIARAFQIPPVFLQDLSKGTFSNTEQQDLQLVKHLIGQWAKAFEDELNLKLYGWRNRERRVKHNLDGLQRGDFKSRIAALAQSIQTAQMTPDEARAFEDRAPYPDGLGSKPYIQGATVPLGSAPIGHNGGPPSDDPTLDDDEKDPADG